MSAGRYVLGVLLLALVAVPLAGGARALRRRLVPGFSGAPARLAEAVCALALLLAVAQLLGTVGALRAGWLALACVLSGGAIAVVLRGGGSGEGAARPAPPAPPAMPALAAAVAAGFLVAFHWLSRSLEVLGRGMADPDTLWYHLPFAARFAQAGWTTRLHFAESEPITTFHPANAELLHAVGMALFGGHDLLSPFVNAGFAALCLLAGWCIGRPRGAGPAAMTGVAVVLLTPIVLQTQPGEAANDAAALAFFLAAAGLLVSGQRRSGALALAAVAAGLALATKLSLVAPVLALALGVVMTAPGRRRAHTVGIWAAALLAAGGFWYLRNLLRVGNPLPWLDLGPLPSPPSPLTDRASFSVAHYFFDAGVWRAQLLPQLDSLGPLWPLLVAAALAGAALGLARGGIARLLGAVALVAVVAYAVTPATAGGPEGNPSLFALNLRFVTPALALGLALLGALPRPGSRAAAWAAPALLLLAAITLAGDGLWPPSSGLVGLGLAAAALTVAAALVRTGRGRRSAALAGGVALLVALAGWPAQQRYAERRYARPGPTLPPPSLWAQRVHGSRIGVVGYLLQYPLYGRDLSNRVDYVGLRGPHGAFRPALSCTRWRGLLRSGGYRYLVVSPVASVALGPPERLPEPRESAWTRSLPGVETVIRLPRSHTSVFRLPPRIGATGCRGSVG